MTSLIPAPNAFVAHKTPFNVRIRTGEYNAAADASWSLVWVQTQCSALMALQGVGHMPANGEDEQEAARVFYVAATRATQRLVGMGVWDEVAFMNK